MKVHEIMTSNVHAVTSGIELASAVEKLWQNDIGALPVINDNGKLIGVITDRDIAVAVATRGQLASEIRVGDVISGRVESCLPDDDLGVALLAMQRHKIRRLPVVNKEGVLQGIISLRDLAVNARESRGRLQSGVSFEDVIATLKAVSEPLESKQVLRQGAQAFTQRQ
ncbi:MAG TPA: CBS domain-containing protein [Blastocatellia bacterium]|nr:CBS domain-containing protein [Blastocatellia bacterium]